MTQTTENPLDKYRYTDSDRLDWDLVDEGIREGDIVCEFEKHTVPAWKTAEFILAHRDGKPYLLDMNEQVVGY